MEAYNKKPPHFWIRLANNSTFHLAIIMAIIVATLFYLILSQRQLIQDEVGRIFDGLPLLSHNASDEEESSLSSSPPPSSMDTEEPSFSESNEASIIEPKGAAAPKKAPVGPPRVEVRYLEVSKDNIRAFVASGQVLRELENWRVVYLPSNSSFQSLLKASRPLPGSVSQPLPPQGDLEILSGDYDPDPNRSFLNFSMIWRLPNSVDWSLITQLRSGESPTSPGPLVLREYEGQMKWNPQGALILIFDPLSRIAVSPQANLSQSPLRVLQSADFQNGLSDLIIWIEVTNLPMAF